MFIEYGKPGGKVKDYFLLLKGYREIYTQISLQERLPGLRDSASSTQASIKGLISMTPSFILGLTSEYIKPPAVGFVHG